MRQKHSIYAERCRITEQDVSQKCHKTVTFPSHLRTVAVSATGVVTDNSLAVSPGEAAAKRSLGVRQSPRRRRYGVCDVDVTEM